MREQVRRYYLQALGVESYLPRWPLPGAAASPVYELEDEPLQALASNEEAPAPEAIPAAAQAVSSVVREALAPLADETARRNPSNVESAEPARQKAARQPAFVLAYWRLSPKLVVLDSRSAAHALPTEQLLGNIALALGLEGSPGNPDLLRWPPPQASALPRELLQNGEAGRAMVQAFLAAQHERQPIGTVLLMGATAAQQVLAADDLPAADDRVGLLALLGQSFSIQLDEQGAPQTAIVVPSLSAMLKKPALKAKCWQAIKGLRHGS